MTAPERLLSLGREYFGTEPSVSALHESGSHRRYFRLSVPGGSVIGVSGTDADEDRAFVALSRHFADKGINVPRVLAADDDCMAYLQEDLGDVTLFDAVSPGRERGRYSPHEQELLLRAIAALPKIQFEGAHGLDWSVCYPSPRFDARSVDFDLNYFKYCYLKNAGVEFNEELLQDDFDALRSDLLGEDSDTFLYRDFQSRNVMLRDGEPWFVDFQGGRRGPIWYDVASFVWQARARYPDSLRESLIEAYIEALSPYRVIGVQEFCRRLRPFVLLRSLQTLGAYGFRGLVEGKRHFLASIPPAIGSLKSQLPTGYPYIDKIVSGLSVPSGAFAGASADMAGRVAVRPAAEPGRIAAGQADALGEGAVLTVEVQSFSYRDGCPEDSSGNGGGFVFDCRGMDNPGRYARYRQMTGRDTPVIEFLESGGEMGRFLNGVFGLTDPHIEKFLSRGFTHMQVSFGCTGGQHRSVYAADRLAEHVKSKYAGVRVVLRHVVLGLEETL